MTAQAGDSLLGETRKGQTYYRVKVENKGGLVLPLHVEITYDDGSKELVKLPADVAEVLTYGDNVKNLRFLPPAEWLAQRNNVVAGWNSQVAK